MKKAILLISIITLFFVGCKKDDIAEASKVRIETETIEKGWDYIKINVEYDYPVELESVTLYLSEKEDMSGAEVYECNVEGKKYSVELDSLKAGVAYYYCYEYDNGYEKEKGDKSYLNTVSKLVVITQDVTNIKATTVTLNGSLTNSDAANKITERGFCWGTEKNPAIEENYISNGNGAGNFTSNILNLIPNTKYYVRAYAKTNFGIVYGEDKTFTTYELLLPIITTKEVTNIKATTAICGGYVSSDGNATVTARGICWSTKPNPTISDSKTTDGSGTGSYTSSLSNLAFQTTYYVRAYATNEKGTSYGEQKSFTTLDKYSGHEYVDLGLPSGLLWATCNVGATSPEESGDYFAWGETSTKETYDEDNCPTSGLTKSELQSQGYIDSEGNLNPQYDAATANWGGTWRMPTYDEFAELITKCTWTWTTQNGVKGYNVEGPNGNSIFLPAAGYRSGSSLISWVSSGEYWSSTPYDSSFHGSAYRLYFSHGVEYVSWDHSLRYDGLPVRPITE